MKVLVCDTDRNNSYDLYDLKEAFAGMKILPEIIKISVEEAERRMKGGEKFDLLIASYDFHEMDSVPVVELIRKIGIPSIFLDYLAHMGVSRYVKNRTAAICVYKDEARYLLPQIIKRVLKL